MRSVCQLVDLDGRNTPLSGIICMFSLEVYAWTSIHLEYTHLLIWAYFTDSAIARVGQNRINTLHTTVYLGTSLLKLPYIYTVYIYTPYIIHRIYIYTVYIYIYVHIFGSGQPYLYLIGSAVKSSVLLP